MDENQRRKVDIREVAKNFLIEHKKVGFIIGTVFVSLLIIYLAFIIFFSKLNKYSAVSQNENLTNQANANKNETFLERLFPTFTEVENNNEVDENGLPILKNSSTSLSTITNSSIDTSDGVEANTAIVEKEPVLAYAVFDKAISIKKYIKNKPKNCLEKISIVLKKDEKSVAVENFQNILKSIEGYEDLEVTGVLDEKTREQIYVFQKRYADILYKNKTNKEPTRLIDTETTHFLNLLCGYDKENSGENSADYINIPTLRYAKKGNREIFDYNTVSHELTTLNNKLATGTQEALFSERGDFVVFRSEGKDGNRGQIISEVVSLNNNNRVNLEKNITTLSFNKKNILVYGIQNNISFTIKTYDPVKNEVKRIAEIPMKEWNIFWLGDGSSGEIGIYNKPSAYASGIFMVLNINTKRLDRRTTAQFGFSVLPTNFNDFSIASIGGVGNLKTILINNKTKTLGGLGLQTFAEKCAQTIIYDGIFCAVPKNLVNNIVYPDDWYKGKYLSEDLLIYKTLAGTTTKVISNFEQKPVSIIQLKVHNNGIFFIDEKTLSLYSIEA